MRDALRFAASLHHSARRDGLYGAELPPRMLRRSQLSMPLVNAGEITAVDYRNKRERAGCVAHKDAAEMLACVTEVPAPRFLNAYRELFGPTRIADVDALAQGEAGSSSRR